MALKLRPRLTLLPRHREKPPHEERHQGERIRLIPPVEEERSHAMCHQDDDRNDRKKGSGDELPAGRSVLSALEHPGKKEEQDDGGKQREDRKPQKEREDRKRGRQREDQDRKQEDRKRGARHEDRDRRREDRSKKEVREDRKPLTQKDPDEKKDDQDDRKKSSKKEKEDKKDDRDEKKDGREGRGVNKTPRTKQKAVPQAGVAVKKAAHAEPSRKKCTVETSLLEDIAEKIKTGKVELQRMEDIKVKCVEQIRGNEEQLGKRQEELALTQAYIQTLQFVKLENEAKLKQTEADIKVQKKENQENADLYEKCRQEIKAAGKKRKKHKQATRSSSSHSRSHGGEEEEEEEEEEQTGVMAVSPFDIGTPAAPAEAARCTSYSYSYSDCEEVKGEEACVVEARDDPDL